MLIHPTVERLRALGLTAMADAFLELHNAPDAGELSREDWLGLLVDREATSRENKRLARRLREARLRQSAVVEDVDFRAHRGLDRALFLKLASCQWIRDHHHLALVGPTGIGKSWLACALGHKACREGFSVLYKRASRLFTDLAQARGEGRLPRLMNALERTRLLIIDDWGPEPLNAEQRRDLLEIVDDRYDRGSLLITSQLPVNRWHEVIGDPTLADAILDRIIHRAHRIDLKGPSLRRRLVASESPAGCMNALRLIAHGGPQRLPTRAAPSLVRALRVARGSPPWTPWTILCRLTGTTLFMQPIFVSTAQIAATLTSTLSAALRRDHDHRNQ